MSDLISRRDAITIPVMPKEHRHYQTNNLDDAYDQGWFDLQNCIERLPSAEPEVLACGHGELIAQPERKTGRWIKISPARIYECSECGKNVMTSDIDAYDFCHGCGVKMEVEHE